MSKQNIKGSLSDNSDFRTPNSHFENPVLFVGAGPGDPELITVKGQKALRDADVVIFAGSLVPEELLQWTRPQTTALSSASMNLEQIIAAIRKIQLHSAPLARAA